jgi:peptidoglycan/LPS O-acetylase OafA/YrhL
LNSPAFQLYFLPYLFAISLVAGLMDLLFKRRRHVVYLTLMLCVLIFYVANGYPQNSHGPEWQKIPAYAFAFLFGNFSRRYLSVMPAVKSLSAVTLAGVLILLVLPAKPIASMFVAPALLWALISFPLVGANKLLVDLGGFSGSIYLWHTPVLLPLLTKVLAGIGVPSLANFILSLLLALGVCILAKLAFTVAFRKWLHCPMPRWLTL